MSGDLDKAREVLAEWIAEDPDDPIARHLYAACSGEDVPERASDRYIARTFDQFASSFDAKLASLEYRAPELVAAALAKALGPPAKTLDGLDAGCGTGLCGPYLAPYCRRLVGVDLSTAMLRHARTRGVYDELVTAELTAYLEEHRSSFDLIASADTILYFGALERVLGAAAGALKPGGLLVITLEASMEAGGTYRLNAHGRYSHTASYASATLAAAGLRTLGMEDAVLRKEAGEPVAGFVVSARKPA
jgi:predicted TPR repeat methyltransferase